MPLVRSDGLPTQHMRALAYWSAAPELDDCHLAAGLRHRVGLPRHLPPPADRRARGPPTATATAAPRAAARRPTTSSTAWSPATNAVDHLEQGRGAADRRPGRVARRRRSTADPGRRRGARAATRRRTGAGADRARLLPPAADLQAGRLRAREAAARGRSAASAGTWPGPRRTAAPPPLAAERRRRRPRLPLRGRPVASSTGATCAARSTSSTRCRWPATSPTSPAGTREGERSPEVERVAQTVLDQGVRGLGLEGA